VNVFTRLFSKKPSYDEAFTDCKCPKDVCAVVSRWIVPTRTGGGEKHDPRVIWECGYGDCDDISFLVHEACRSIFIQSTVEFFWPMNRVREGHALCHGIWNDIHWVCDNGTYLEHEEPEPVAADALNCSRVWSRRMT
jgi:hypothetical protein